MSHGEKRCTWTNFSRPPRKGGQRGFYEWINQKTNGGLNRAGKGGDSQYVAGKEKNCKVVYALACKKWVVTSKKRANNCIWKRKEASGNKKIQLREQKKLKTPHTNLG